MVKKEPAIKLNLTSTSLQSDFRARRLKIPKQPAYYNLLIDRFNVKLWGGFDIIEGLDKVNENKP